jgi:CubicO group peptidase (beta-lactamase class C family)
LTATQAERLRYEPGQGWAYSNIGYLEVAQLIEKASVRPLAEALAELVFIPAELATPRLAAMPADLAEVCMGDAVGYHPGWVYHGLVLGTALDAGRLLRMLLAGRLIGSHALDRMLERRALPQFRSEIYPDPAYGLGLMLSAANPLDHPVGHRGMGPGSRFAAFGQQGLTCVIWAEDTSGVDPEVEVIRSLRNGSL